MKHHTLRNLLLRTSLATCALAWVATGCGSSGGSSGSPLGSDDGGSSSGGSSSGSFSGSSGGSSGGVSSSSSGGASSSSSSGGSSSGGSSGSSSGSGHDGGGPPPAVACKTGDRQEWSGAVGTTGISVAVCSLCGSSYVVASNGTGGAGQVTIDNGMMTTLSVPAGGTATSANVTDKAADGTVTVCATGTSHVCLPNATPNQRYCNPYRDLTSLVAERIDQGVDYGGAGPIYAMGPGTIDVYKNRNDSGWPGGTFVSYKVTAGPAVGKEVYLAENIDLNPSLQSGSFVYNGTSLGTLVDASPDSESGWGVAGESVTAEYSCYTEGCMTPLGVNFNALIMCLGTPSGTMGTGGCCPQPTGWPSDWCSMITAWQ